MTLALRHEKFKLTKENLIILLCGAAGVIYNSWPLGFILDPLVAKNNQASQLETTGHPYYQLFIACDVISSLLLITCAVLIWLYFTKKLEFRLIAIGLVAFGVFTSIASLLPAKCSISSYLRCGAGYNYGIGLDLVFSSLAILGLLLALSGMLQSLNRAELLKARVGIIITVTTVFWIISLLAFSVLAIEQVHAAIIVQYIELTLAGIAMVMLAIGVRAHGV
jgi:hypothetical protein